MKSSSSLRNSELRIPIAGVLTWLLPGAGHLFIGEKVRGAIFLVAITLTFWTGVAIGGAKSTVAPKERQLWFLAQICAGGHSMASIGLGNMISAADGERPSDLIAYGGVEEVAVIYTATCGLLNILIFLDVLVRAEKVPARSAAGGVPVPKGGGGPS